MTGASGCAEDPHISVDPTSALQASDSAGIRVVSFDRNHLPLLAEIATGPDWIIGEGGAPGLAPPLHGVTSVIQIGEEQIVLSEGSTQEVLFVDLEAGAIERAGGAGDGPEEFRGLSGIYPSAEGLIRAVDQRRMRIVDMQWGGELAGTTALPHLFGEGIGGRIVIDGTGSVYIAQLSAILAPGAERRERPSGVLVRVGTRSDTLVGLRGREAFSNEMGMGSVLWGATTEVGPAPDGVWLGDTDAPRLELWSDPDRPAGVIRWTDDSDRTITDADIDAFLQRMEEAAEPHERAQIRGMRDLVPFAEQRPHFGPIVAGLDGSVWIGPPRDLAFEIFEGQIEGLEPASEWVVVHPWGGTAGRVVTPAGFRLALADDGYVIGIHRDALGRESVRRYRMGPARVCRALPDDIRLLLESRAIPAGWTISDAVIVRAEDIVRESDDAPSEVIVARVLEEDGTEFARGPAEWVIEGGTDPEDPSGGPREYSLLNPASHALLERLAEERPVRALPDATAGPGGWTLDHPAAVSARDCLAARS